VARASRSQREPPTTSARTEPPRSPSAEGGGLRRGFAAARPVLWAIRNQHGGRVSERELRGHVWIANFIFTRCLLRHPWFVLLARDHRIVRAAGGATLRSRKWWARHARRRSARLCSRHIRRRSPWRLRPDGHILGGSATSAAELSRIARCAGARRSLREVTRRSGAVASAKHDVRRYFIGGGARARMSVGAAPRDVALGALRPGAPISAPLERNAALASV
jgi:hypothetical protein